MELASGNRSRQPRGLNTASAALTECLPTKEARSNIVPQLQIKRVADELIGDMIFEPTTPNFVSGISEEDKTNLRTWCGHRKWAAHLGSLKMHQLFELSCVFL